MAYGGRIPDSSFSATSSYDYAWLPKYGRLHGPRRGWTPKPPNNMPNEYLQIDLGGEYWVCGVATQGEGSHILPDEWTTKFKLNLSLTNRNWKFYQWNGSDKVGPVFSASNDQYQISCAYRFYRKNELIPKTKTTNITQYHLTHLPDVD